MLLLLLTQITGIKKRQHKMLDYDSMRAKVKKLTEKPDKDPGKLPRTEKEAEMVGQQAFLLSPLARKSQPYRKSSPDDELDLTIPSPPKAIQRPEIQKLRSSERTPDRNSSMNSSLSTRTLSQVTSWSSGRPQGSGLGRSPSMALQKRSATSSGASSFNSTYNEDATTQEKSGQGTPVRTDSPLRVIRNPAANLSQDTVFSQHGASLAARRDVAATSRPSTLSITPASTRSHRSMAATPFFQPSELEEIMQPFKLEFMKKQADELEQSKAAYEQLNEQLTTELPQLIDLR